MKKEIKGIERLNRDREIIKRLVDTGGKVTKVAKEFNLSKGRITQIKKEMQKRSLQALQFSAIETVNQELSELDVFIEEMYEKIEKIESTLDVDGNEIGIANAAYYAQILKAKEMKHKLLSLPELFSDEILRTRDENSNISFVFRREVETAQQPQIADNQNQSSPLVAKTLTQEITESVISEAKQSGLMNQNEFEISIDDLNKLRDERKNKKG